MTNKDSSQFRVLFLLAGTMVALTVSASIITYTYDPAGRLVAADHGGSKTISYAYDNAGNLVQSSQPSPGIVVGPVVNSQFTLSWPAAPAGFVLESSATIGTGVVWSSSGISAPTSSGNVLTVTLPVTDATKFYRLRKP